jgi:hypothetical protein
MYMSDTMTVLTLTRRQVDLVDSLVRPLLGDDSKDVSVRRDSCEIISEIAVRRVTSQWFLASESLPELGECVLTWRASGFGDEGYQCVGLLELPLRVGDATYWADAMTGRRIEPTHWMPLPEPPSP